MAGSSIGVVGFVVIWPVLALFAWYVQRKPGDGHDVSFERVANSRFRRIPAWGLCCMRGTFFLYIFGVQVYDYVVHGGLTLDFFTEWNWIILGIYFGLTSIATAAWMCMSRSQDFHAESQDATRWRWVARVCQALSSLVATNVLMVDVVLWGVLYTTTPAADKSNFIDFTQLNMHAVNFFMVLPEMVLNDVTPRRNDLGVVIAVALTYALFTIVRLSLRPATAKCLTSSCDWKVDGHIAWPYFFLDTSIGWISPICYIALIIVQSLFFKITLVFRLAIDKRSSKLPIREVLDTERAVQN